MSTVSTDGGPGPLHVLPEVWSDERQHILDDAGRCWCGPMVEDDDAGLRTITHKPQQLDGTVRALGAASC